MKFRFDVRSRHLRGFWVGAAGSGLRQRACGGSESATSGHSRNFRQSRAVALVEVIGQMEGMRPPSTRMMLPVM